MDSKKTFKIIAAVIVAIILIYSFVPAQQVPYQETVEMHRKEIQDFFRFDEESPLPDSLKSEEFTLDYYAVDPEYKVRASLEKTPGREVMKIPTSDGEIREYTRYAYAIFELQGKEYRLTLLKPTTGEEDGLFLPFSDLTNGNSTYGGGRYLDLETTTQNKITIDFNLAYNPYCVYNATYSCPLPPSENDLKVAIPAGERNFGEIL